MGQEFGIEKPGAHGDAPHRPPTRYLVILDSGGVTIARLFKADRSPAADFDAGIEEVTLMIRGLVPEVGASGPEWDRALQGHNAAERAAARVFTLDL